LDDYHSPQTIIVANWKMYKTQRGAIEFFDNLLPLIKKKENPVVVCPPATLLPIVSSKYADRGLFFGAQNIHWVTEGAYTGEISAEQATDAGAHFVICGHSERRHYFEESNEMVSHKVAAALNQGLRPILCIGETLEEREAGDALEVLRQDLFASLATIEPTTNIVIAYEPVWAIGTGKVASPADAEDAIGFIRIQLRELWGKLADEVSILYGGSVKPENIVELMACPNINGALVGGASLKAESFAAIVNYNK